MYIQCRSQNSAQYDIGIYAKRYKKSCCPVYIILGHPVLEAYRVLQLAIIPSRLELKDQPGLKEPCWLPKFFNSLNKNSGQCSTFK